MILKMASWASIPPGRPSYAFSPKGNSQDHASSPKISAPTVKTGMARLGITKEVRDAVQNHKPQGIGDRAYNFHAYAREKREALQRWADHVIAIVEANSLAKAA